MMDQKQDFLIECNSERLPAQEFMSVWCRRCRNSACRNANWGLSKWIARMNTQEDRLLKNPNFADEGDPQYQHIREVDFPDLLKQAIRLEIASKKNDWNIPSQEDVKVHLASLEPVDVTIDTLESVDDATKALAKAKGKPEPDLPLINKNDKGEEEGVPNSSLDPPNIPSVFPQNPPLTPPSSPAPKTPSRFLINTHFPPDGVMLENNEVSSIEEDPWAPRKKEKKVEVGAKIKIGSRGKDDE